MPYFYIFPHTIIDHMEPYANLSFGVVGWKCNGEIQIVEKDEETCLYTKPLVFTEFTWSQILRFASRPSWRVYKKPHKRVYTTLRKTNEWMGFEATMYRHWWKGNPMTLRYHTFFRTIREATPTSNVIHNGKRINYVDATSMDNWKIHRKGTWVSLNNFMGSSHTESVKDQDLVSEGH